VSTPFSSWRVGAPYYLPLLILSALVTWAGLRMGTIYPAIPFWVVTLFAVNFFRDPPRTISQAPDDITSPADGTVDAIEDLETCEFYDGPCKRVSIFLSVFNVHINRMPDDAEIVDIQYKEGIYKNAMDPESHQVNEANTLFLSTPHGPMAVRQVSGAIARRIICVPKPGAKLTKGEKFGMIKFGSRTDLYLSPDAHIEVQLKDKVKGGSTIIARFP